MDISKSIIFMPQNFPAKNVLWRQCILPIFLNDLILPFNSVWLYAFFYMIILPNRGAFLCELLINQHYLTHEVDVGYITLVIFALHWKLTSTGS